MLKIVRFFVVIRIFAVILFFSTCSTTRNRESSYQFTPVYITDSKKINILKPEYMEENIDSYQIFSGKFDSKTFSSLVYLQADKTALEMTLLNEFGTSMGTLSYAEDKISFSSPYFPKNIKAEYILSDFQNVYYDISALKENYAKAGLTFTCSNVDGTEYRLVQDGTVVIEEIIKNKQEITITNKLRSYSYNLREIQK